MLRGICKHKYNSNICFLRLLFIIDRHNFQEIYRIRYNVFGVCSLPKGKEALV